MSAAPRIWLITITLAGAAACSADTARQTTVPPAALPASSSRAPDETPALPAAIAPLADGEVHLADGPFNDRFRLDGLRFEPGQAARVTGTVLITSDVSELLALEIEAAFYDATGQLAGTARQTYDAEAGKQFHQRPIPFSLVPPDPAPTAIAALVRVPQLANE